MAYATRVSRLRLIDAVYPPETDFDTHVHEEGYACLVVEGRYREWTPRAREVGAGVDQTWPAGSRHAVRTGPSPVRILHVADPTGGGPLFDRPLRVGVLMQLAAALTAGPPEPDDDVGRLHLECLLTMLEDGEESAEPSGSPGDRRSTSPTPEPWLQRTRARLREGLTDPVTISELAEEAGRHPSHVTRAFRQRWGMTPGQYARRVRVAEAVRRLRQTDLPLSEIAFATGFSDQSHMGRWMRRYAGVTPGEIRAGGGAGATDR